MADLDEGSVGIQILAGLPAEAGLSSIAGEILDTPRTVYALVALRPSHEVHRLEKDSYTMVMRLAEIEPVAGDEADAVRRQLDTLRERRTGVRPMVGSDGEPTPEAVVATATGGDLPTGPEWGDGPGPVPSEADIAANSTTTPTAPSGAVPPFAEPTPIAKKRRQS